MSIKVTKKDLESIPSKDKPTIKVAKKINKNNNNEFNDITIIGTGAWGTAIAKVLSESGNNVTMFGVDKKEIKDINQHGMNKKYYGTTKINTIIKATSDIDKALINANYVVFALPSAHLKDMLKIIKNRLKHKVIFINLVKGIDPANKKPWSFTISKILKNKSNGLASIIGPSFAIDVYHKKQTIVNVVSNNDIVCNKVAKLFSVPYLKVVKCPDEIGAETIAAYKNLLAIGMGMVFENTKSINTISAVLTQGIKEIAIISKNNGGKPSTIVEFCGIGDIFLTCTSDLSRNFTFGKNLYKKNTNKSFKIGKITVEGYTLYEIVKKEIINNKNLPLFKSICLVLSKEIKPKNIITNTFELINKSSVKN
ncbi:MAG: NAD(P)H-dependent glycerol-3-phosphate dehydrogenase [Mycoplasmoidaceae bacterium]